MGKAGKSRKRARKEAAIGSHESESAGEEESGVDAVDLEITERTLRRLLDSGERLRSPAARTIRSQAFAIVEALGKGKSMAGRVSDALHDGRWTDALQWLEQLSEAPALGALQRWIRDLFESSKTMADPVITCQILYRILTCAGQTAWGSDDGCISGPMKVFPMWFSIPRAVSPAKALEDSSWVIPEVHVLSIESAWREGMTVWTCDSQNILDECPSNMPFRINVPFVPGAFMMHHVLSPKECQRILSVADAMGFTPEASYSLSSSSGTSTAADGVVWIVSEALNNELWQRVAPLLPSELCHGKLVHLNSRWRIYRYTTGTVYRPHIDGAWTGSGVVDGVYVNDIYDGKVTSRLTFLIYLNDNFEQGGTTFYAPAHEEGCIAARSIAPIQGSILCFPHGPGVERVGLVHEGSAVTNGTKYVMRSDVLYEKNSLI